MADSYPVALHLEGRRCVVVGGGTVGARKVHGLLAAGAKVTVISPKLCAELEALTHTGTIQAVRLPYSTQLLGELRPSLVFATTDDPTVNAQIAGDARHLEILINRADDGIQGDFENMAIVRRGGVTIAVSTGGASPTLGKLVAELVAGYVGEEYGVLAEWMANHRREVRASMGSQAERAGFWQLVIDSPILDKLRMGQIDDARDLFDQLMSAAGGGA